MRREMTRSKGYSVGLLEQEPQLDPTKTVKEVVEEGKKGTGGAAPRVRSGEQQDRRGFPR